MNLSIFEAAINAVLGYAVVFVGIVLLMVVVIIAGKLMHRNAAFKVTVTPGKDGPTAAVSAASTAVAPGSAGKIALHDVPDREAAMVMAIVADKLGKPLNELRFKSIKEVK